MIPNKRTSSGALLRDGTSRPSNIMSKDQGRKRWLRYGSLSPFCWRRVEFVSEFLDLGNKIISDRYSMLEVMHHITLTALTINQLGQVCRQSVITKLRSMRHVSCQLLHCCYGRFLTITESNVASGISCNAMLITSRNTEGCDFGA